MRGGENKRRASHEQQGRVLTRTNGSVELEFPERSLAYGIANDCVTFSVCAESLHTV